MASLSVCVVLSLSLFISCTLMEGPPPAGSIFRLIENLEVLGSRPLSKSSYYSINVKPINSGAESSMVQRERNPIMSASMVWNLCEGCRSRVVVSLSLFTFPAKVDQMRSPSPPGCAPEALDWLPSGMLRNGSQ